LYTKGRRKQRKKAKKGRLFLFLFTQSLSQQANFYQSYFNTMMNSATAAGAAEPSPAEDGNSLIDLSTILDKSACYARNENAGFPWGNLFIGDSRLGMRSDADEQLILHLSFQEFVRVSLLVCAL
jgi:hypothetical protein